MVGQYYRGAAECKVCNLEWNNKSKSHNLLSKNVGLFQLILVKYGQIQMLNPMVGFIHILPKHGLKQPISFQSVHT